MYTHAHTHTHKQTHTYIYVGATLAYVKEATFREIEVEGL